MATDSISTHPRANDARYLDLKARVAALGCRLVEDEWGPSDGPHRPTPGLYIHNQRLAVYVDGWWETYRDVAPGQVEELLASCAQPAFIDSRQRRE